MFIENVLIFYGVILVVGMLIWGFYAIGHAIYRHHFYSQTKRWKNSEIVDLSDELEDTFSSIYMPKPESKEREKSK
ncbi:TPA: hypothetical protein QHL53_000787 [Proteus mirabilis]|nr:hypothetical protein [Proteus mirabilis]